MKITYQLNKLDLINLLAKVYNVDPGHVTFGMKTQWGPDGQYNEPYAFVQCETNIKAEKDK